MLLKVFEPLTNQMRAAHRQGPT